MEMKVEGEPDPRVYFAAERTFLAWLRTGLALMGFGFVVARVGLLVPQAPLETSPEAWSMASSRALGIGLTVVGMLLAALAYASHVATVRRLNRGEPFVGHPTWLGGVVAVLLVIMGSLMTTYLATL